MKDNHVEDWVQAKERGNVELKRIVTHNLGDGVWPITEWTKLPMGPCKELFLQLQPNFVSHLKIMWHPMLIMALLVLSIGILYNILKLLVDVVDLLNELSVFFSCSWSM